MKTIPKEILKVITTLHEASFEAYLVGGCVRDLLMERKPKDWDVTTNAKPEQIQALFEKTFYENSYGTVGVVNEEIADTTLEIVEVTPYRLESSYSDKRHPDEVTFTANLTDDLERRDFTINAIAYNPLTDELVDPHNGRNDIIQKCIRAVGNPLKRFDEDALRMMRAVRLSAELSFTIDPISQETITHNAHTITHIASERIRDELSRIILSDNPKQGIELLFRLGLLHYIIPELEAGIGIGQNQAHSYEVFEHVVRALQAAADKGFSLEVRLAALFHDIAKPHTKVFDNKKKDWSFHGHEVVGAKIAKKRLTELRFPSTVIEKVTKLVRWHMFFSDTEQITLSAVRRLIRNVGPENVQDLMNIRVCDRIGTGRPKEKPYRFRKYQSMIEEALRDPVSVGMLKIDGKRIMEITSEKPGPRIGWILHALLEDVLDDPARNTTEYLEKKARELSQLPNEPLQKMGEKGKEKKEEEEEKEVKEIRGKYWVE